VSKYPAKFRYHVNNYLSDDFLTYTLPLNALEHVGTVDRNTNYSELFNIDLIFGDYLSIYGIDFRKNRYTRAIPKHLCGYLSIKNYDIPQPTLCADDWATSGLWAIDTWEPYCGNSEICSWEYEITALKKQTSPGAPWNRKYRTKAQALRDDEVLCFVGEEWLRLADEALCTLYTYNNKGEVRAIEKVQVGKLRGFMGADLVFVMTCDRLNRLINEKFYESNMLTPNCVGMSKFCRKWHALFL
jgi:hypothetical protein